MAAMHGWDPGFREVDEDKGPEASSGEMDEELSRQLDQVYESYLEKGERPQDAGEEVEKIPCRNQDLEGKTHPETGVPFQRREIQVEGKRYEVVVPEFESKFEARLPSEQYKASYPEQFRACDAQLREAVARDPALREQFDADQLEQIEDGETPDGCTWHHDAEEGRMQLVDTETHRRTAHTGGHAFWGGQ